MFLKRQFFKKNVYSKTFIIIYLFNKHNCFIKLRLYLSVVIFNTFYVCCNFKTLYLSLFWHVSTFPLFEQNSVFWTSLMDRYRIMAIMICWKFVNTWEFRQFRNHFGLWRGGLRRGAAQIIAREDLLDCFSSLLFHLFRINYEPRGGVPEITRLVIGATRRILNRQERFLVNLCIGTLVNLLRNNVL